MARLSFGFISENGGETLRVFEDNAMNKRSIVEVKIYLILVTENRQRFEY